MFLRLICPTRSTDPSAQQVVFNALYCVNQGRYNHPKHTDIQSSLKVILLSLFRFFFLSPSSVESFISHLFMSLFILRQKRPLLLCQHLIVASANAKSQTCLELSRALHLQRPHYVHNIFTFTLRSFPDMIILQIMIESV